MNNLGKHAWRIFWVIIFYILALVATQSVGISMIISMLVVIGFKLKDISEKITDNAGTQIWLLEMIFLRVKLLRLELISLELDLEKGRKKK